MTKIFLLFISILFLGILSCLKNPASITGLEHYQVVFSGVLQDSVVLGNNRFYLYKINDEGENRHSLVPPNGDAQYLYPDFSPEGSRIVFYQTTLAQGRMFVMNNDGSNLQQIDDELGVKSVKWSPDGSFIAYRTVNNLYVIKPNGTGKQLLSDSTTSAMDWSPDGKKLVFTRGENSLVRRSDVFTIEVDGSNLMKLTDDETFDTDPVWSPDGSLIAYLVEREDSSVTGTIREIYVVEGDGRNPHVLVPNDTYGIGAMSWSPDGTKLAFVMSYPRHDPFVGVTELFVVNRDGTGLRRLTNFGREVWNVDWSPDGVWISVVAETVDQFNGQNLWLIRSDGGGERFLTNDMYQFGNYSWSPVAN